MRSLLLLPLLAACTPEPAEDWSYILPSERVLVDLPSDVGGARDAGDVSEYWQVTIEAGVTINGLVEMVLGLVDEVTSYDPTWTDDSQSEAAWGPWDDGGENEVMLGVRQFEDGHFEWAFSGRPAGAGDDAWIALIAGDVEAGATETAAVGQFGIDFTAISSLDPDESATGVFYVTYDVAEDHADCEAAFDDFADGEAPADVGYRYGDDATGGFMDLALTADVTGNDVQELNIVRTRWLPTGEGRGDAYVTQGDLGELVYTASECWGSDSIVTFWETNAELERSGDASTCVFAEAEWSEDAPE